VQRTAWLLDNVAPPTFPDRFRSGPLVYAYDVDRATRRRVVPECARAPYDRVETSRWPAALEPWLSTDLRKRSVPPDWTPHCARTEAAGGNITIVGLSDNAVIRRAAGQGRPQARLEIRGYTGEVNWMVNGRLVGRAPAAASRIVIFPEAGRYDITAFDSEGRYDRVSVSVRGE
jgi:penicillin-binding protein 1C